MTQLPSARLRRPIVTDSSVQVSRWPRIPTEEREVAEIIAASVQRSRNGEPASVLHEERLAHDISRILIGLSRLPRPAGCHFPLSLSCRVIPAIGRPPSETRSSLVPTSTRCRS